MLWLPHTAGWHLPARAGSRRARRSDEQEDVFFFEKKNQKTFALALCPPDAPLIDLARNRTDRRFLVLFFKKEHVFLCLLDFGCTAFNAATARAGGVVCACGTIAAPAGMVGWLTKAGRQVSWTPSPSPPIWR
jgi:hypothetical protein